MSDPFVEKFLEVFDKGGLRVNEVATILQRHRATINRWRNEKRINCDRATINRINVLIELVDTAVEDGMLPIDSGRIVGKNRRLAYIIKILKTQQAKRV